MTDTRKKEIENLTIDLLKEYGLFRADGAAPIFVKDDLQKHFTFTFREEELDDNLQGVIFQGKTSVKIVVNSMIDNVGRKNFTYAHEMGHYFLTHDLSTLVCTQANLEGGFWVKDPQEAEANYFASCFLMPKDYVLWNYYNVVKTYLRIYPFQKLYVDNYNYRIVWRTVCSYFLKQCGVSNSALKYRLEDLGLLDWHVKQRSQPENSFEMLFRRGRK